MQRQRPDAFAGHALAVLAWPPAPALAARRPGHGIERQVAAHPADHGVAVGDRGQDQPAAHEPGVEQQADPAEPVAQQAHQEARAPQLAPVGAAPHQPQHQRHRADLPAALDHRGQAQPALAAHEARPVRLGGVVVVDQRAGRPRRAPLDHRVINHDVPDGGREQRG
jgi:hypothetical protein